MGTTAYFLINADRQVAQREDYYAKAIAELEAIPEVEFAEPVSGIYDLMVKVDVPIRAILVANKMLEKAWVKRLHVLRVEPIERERRERVETIEREGVEYARATAPSVKVTEQI